MAKSKRADEVADENALSVGSAAPAPPPALPHAVIYRGGHPLIRRRGVVLEHGKSVRVAPRTATLLVADGDCDAVHA